MQEMYRSTNVAIVGVFVTFMFFFTACGGGGDSSATVSVESKNKAKSVTSTAPKRLTRDEVVAARKKYEIKVVSFDASQEIGTEFPYSDYVRVRIKNNSKVCLPYLTVLTKRYNAKGKMIGSSRAPSISVGDLKPGEPAEVDYYPKGHLPGVKRISVEIEKLISADAVQFFKEISP